MKSPKHIQLEAIELDKHKLKRLDVQTELLKQTNGKHINTDNYLLGVIRNFFDDTELPFELDYVFQMKNTSLYKNTKFTIRGCFNNGTKFHTKLWQGYTHLAIIELENKSSDIFQSLKPFNIRKRWDPVLILCDSRDSKYCRESITSGLEKHEKFMKENNLERWKSLKQEEEEYKRANE